MELDYTEKKVLQEVLSYYIRAKREKDSKLDMDGKFYQVAHNVIKADIENAENLLNKLYQSISEY